jgi:hypothetical protein
MNTSKREALTRLSAVDFLVEMVEYLDPKDLLRVRVEKMIEDAQNEREISMEVLSSAVKEIGRATWPIRIALRSYLKTSEGAMAEWKGITASVRNSTEHILERFKSVTRIEDIDQMLEHEESDSALKESERMEIREVRTHLLPYLWHTHKQQSADELKKAKEILSEIEKRLAKLRELALEDLINGKQIMEKVEEYEDRMFGNGEMVDLAILDDEIVFFHDMKPEVE